MSKVCAICGKKPGFGHNRSHSMVATKRRFNPNLQRLRLHALPQERQGREGHLAAARRLESNLRLAARRLTNVAETALTISSELGTITVAPEAIGQIVGRVAAECYGVVGMSLRAPGAPRERVTRLLPKGRPLRGVVVRNAGGAVALELYVVVAYGLNLAEVAATLRSRVAYEVARLTGLEVASVDVHIQDVKRTA